MPEEYGYGFEEFENNNYMVSMTDMLQTINTLYLQYSEPDKTVDEIKYAYLDCGNDGLQELLVQFVGVDLYSMDDDSDVTYIIRYEDGKLAVCYCGGSWARSSTSYSYYGCIDTCGSGGAGDSYYSSCIMDEAGVLNSIYNLEMLSGWWTNYVNTDAYNEVLGNEELDAEFRINIYSIGEEIYYTYEIEPPANVEKCEEYIELCKQNGAMFYSEEEVQQVISQQIDILGIDEECLTDRAPEWQSPNASFYSEYVSNSD